MIYCKSAHSTKQSASVIIEVGVMAMLRGVLRCVLIFRECPAGTCDGCTFHFLWESSSACPRCTEEDYHQIEGVCKGGMQVILIYPVKVFSHRGNVEIRVVILGRWTFHDDVLPLTTSVRTPGCHRVKLHLMSPSAQQCTHSGQDDDPVFTSPCLHISSDFFSLPHDPRVALL